MQQPVGKAVWFRLYLHTSALTSASEEIVQQVKVAVDRARPPSFNVVRIDRVSRSVGLLDYPTFFEDAFPKLCRAWKVDGTSGPVSFRDYSNSLNPPILHRKELLLPTEHPDIPLFARLTSSLENLGLFGDPVRIGFDRQWQMLLRESGYRVVGHDLVPVGNDECPCPADAISPFTEVQRHLTALSRQGFSAPVVAMMRVGILNSQTTFFDYGCGRGSDVALLTAAGIPATGWDPYFAPEKPVSCADVVNIGFVINVIEDPVERRTALKRAFALANVAISVSAMLAHEDSIAGRPYADGVLTSRNTFQKYYSQAELRDYIQHTLATSAIALAPGVFVLFKDKAAEQRFELSRSRSKLRVPARSVPQFNGDDGLQTPSPPIKPRRPRSLKATIPPPWERCPEAFRAMCVTWEQLGRSPSREELVMRAEIEQAFGTLKKALQVASGHLDPTRLAMARAQRTEDILVYLALQRVRRRQQYKQLEPSLQRDIRAFFGDYSTALARADRFLVEAASPEAIVEAATLASEHGLGWLIEGKSLQLHASLVNRLPAVLRVYVGCAGILYGEIEMADMVKIHIATGKVTLIRCDDFSNAIPRMLERTKIDLRDQRVRIFSYGAESSFEPPLLYQKSRFMNEEMAEYAEQAEFDALLENVITIDSSMRGPDARGFEACLKRAGLRVEGRRLVNDDRPPSLNDKCGAHLTFRDLIVCGESALRTALPNLPKEPDTYRALRALAECILDPVIDWYGSIELTYGFCSTDLAKTIPGRIAPALDQHSAHETKRNGNLICSRLGAAADFLVRDENMLEVAKWISANTKFDRLYYYGNDRPIHVSYGPDKKGEAFQMVLSPTGRLIPKKLKLDSFS